MRKLLDILRVAHSKKKSRCFKLVCFWVVVSDDFESSKTTYLLATVSLTSLCFCLSFPWRDCEQIVEWCPWSAEFCFAFRCTQLLGLSRWPSGKESACSAGDAGLIPGLERSPEGGNGNHSSILAWKILWTEEPGEPQSMGSQSQIWLTMLTRTHIIFLSLNAIM